jgi:hypothetical protein
MSEVAEVKFNTESASVNIEAPTKSLAEKREDLQTRLQINRRLLEEKLLQPGNQNFPRSATMRLLSSPGTHHFIRKFAGAAIGLQAFKSLRYGVSLFQFARSAYSAFKATRNVVKAKDGKPME